METVDVAVVGGGPAGTSAAEQAATRDADVVVLEKGVPREDREGLGPDSTDAAGMLDYWLDIMDEDYREIPDGVVQQELDRTDFVGPNEACTLRNTGIESSYPGFGFTFHRARMDDWLRERAEEAGADYRVGVAVTDVETDLTGGHSHTLSLADGSTIEAEYLILADGPQRQVTLGALDQFMPDGRSVSEHLSPPSANHIAYQEYRRFPEEAFEETALKFWWGVMPGETAYPWVFPNADRVARVGLTMPIGLDIDAIDDRDEYALLRPEDDRIPRGETYIRRLLEREYGDEYDVESDFPILEDRGKNGGTETYPISSTRPIDSPTAAGIAVTGGAMGTTSAFHEGGYHVAVRSGKIAGTLAATDSLDRYNAAWKDAIGDEILRNIAFADLVADYEPADWDHVFRTARRMLSSEEGAVSMFERRFTAGPAAIRLIWGYKWRKFKNRNGKYVQIVESEYSI